jgi:hypothetical protein
MRVEPNKGRVRSWLMIKGWGGRRKIHAQTKGAARTRASRGFRPQVWGVDRA